ncbi:MFS transporter [uncultured Paludibaculum sp.]|uniref:MFS transporter n=1 Tax=uncultured Paludibaculum sp. TaxID=1765020 RepID=UPI002AABC141|nr:MFS transporter [uncultured Paludibaculum sp.]
MNKRALAAGCAVGFAFSANYTNHAPMVPALRAEFGFDNASAGLLTTGIFLTHAAMQVPGGRLADRFGPARVLMAALAWVVLANFAIAFAGSYGQLLFWKAVAGIGTGVCFAAGARYIVASFEGRDLHVAQGFFGGSVVLGSGYVLFAVPQLLSAFGWRGGFVGSALVAATVWLWWIVFAPPPSHHVPASGGLREMMRSRDLWLLGIVQMASFGLVIVVGTWITTLLKTTFQTPLKTAGLMGSAVLLLGIVSRPLGGWLVHRMPVRSLVRAALLLNAAACLALAWGHWIELTLASIVVLGIGCGLPYAGLFNRAAALFPGRAGAAMGLVNMVGILMILAGAPAVGFLADWTGQFQSSFLTLGAFALMAAGAASAITEKQ